MGCRVSANPKRTGTYWDTHLAEAENENIRFLTSNGLSLEAACRRLGLNPDTVAKRAERNEHVRK